MYLNFILHHGRGTISRLHFIIYQTRISLDGVFITIQKSLNIFFTILLHPSHDTLHTGSQEFIDGWAVLLKYLHGIGGAFTLDNVGKSSKENFHFVCFQERFEISLLGYLHTNVETECVDGHFIIVVGHGSTGHVTGGDGLI